MMSSKVIGSQLINVTSWNLPFSARNWMPKNDDDLPGEPASCEDVKDRAAQGAATRPCPPYHRHYAVSGELGSRKEA